MKTEEFVALLAARSDPETTGLPARRFAMALACGGLISVLLMAALLGARPTLARDASLPMLWVKFAFIAALIAASLLAALRLSCPGRRLDRLPGILAAPVLALWVLAAVALFAAEPAARPALVLGQTWRDCGLRIAGLSAPLFVALLWAIRGLAPTRLRLAGAAAGLLAGAAGALVYAFHCPELAAPFLGIWYVIGMLIPAGLGALIGRRALRW